jgi:hypothetical protein
MVQASSNCTIYNALQFVPILCSTVSVFNAKKIGKKKETNKPKKYKESRKKERIRNKERKKGARKERNFFNK